MIRPRTVLIMPDHCAATYGLLYKDPDLPTDEFCVCSKRLQDWKRLQEEAAGFNMDRHVNGCQAGGSCRALKWRQQVEAAEIGRSIPESRRFFFSLKRSSEPQRRFMQSLSCSSDRRLPGPPTPGVRFFRIGAVPKVNKLKSQ